MRCGKKSVSEITWTNNIQKYVCEEHEKAIRTVANYLGFRIIVESMGSDNYPCECKIKE